MATDYIRRSAVVNYLNDVWLTATPNDGMPDINKRVAAARAGGVRDAMDAVEAIPAADVVEVTHAEWMAENSRPKSGAFYCSNCHRTCYDPQPTRAMGWTKRCRYHYCPSCGAKMDGGQDDD